MKTMQSDTPRTDALVYSKQAFDVHHPVVSASFARRLERDLNAANAEIVKLKTDCPYCHGQGSYGHNHRTFPPRSYICKNCNGSGKRPVDK